VRTEQLADILRLYSVPQVGSYKARQLISVFGTAGAALQASPRQLQIVPGIGQKSSQQLRAGVDERFVERQLEAIAKGRQNVVSFWDEAYPSALRQIYDPPLLLFYLGRLELLKLACLAIVGSRSMTPYGARALKRILPPLRGEEVCIVSGMARGIDTMAHSLSLANRIHTAAVPAHGLDRIYPPDNVELWQKLASEQLILTEHPLGSKMDPRYFPRRNRIISGLASGTLLIEAGPRSGALISADFALEQNRDVLVVPGPIDSEQSSGTNRLLCEGATPIVDGESLREWFGFDNPKHSSLVPETEKVPPQDERLAIIYKQLTFSPLHIDQLALRCQLPAADVLARLLELELDGYVRQMPGKLFVRIS
jgi:DNA processing protein